MIKSDYRKTLGSFATGVTVITTSKDGSYYVFTANSFTSVSLEPPLVLFCIKDDATFVNVVKDSMVFAINILSSDQEALSNKFSNPNLINSERFENTSYSFSDLGCPVMDGSMAVLDCRVQDIKKAGDHYIVIGLVESFSKAEGMNPLLYFKGGYSTIKGH